MDKEKIYHQWTLTEFLRDNTIENLKFRIEKKFGWRNDLVVENYIPIVTIRDTKNSQCRFQNVLDSSIWFYTSDESSKSLPFIKDRITKNRKRYSLKSALEYRDFYMRMLTNNDVTGAHKQFVSPFLFHSEQELRHKIKFEKDEEVEQLKKYKWRILLVDDHGDDNKLTPIWEPTEESINYNKQEEIKNTLSKLYGKDYIKTESLPSKLDIIKEELSELFGKDYITTESTDTTAHIYIDCVNTLVEARNKLKEKKYEIILLDYLLGAKQCNKWGKIIEREYSYELLEDIKKQEDERTKKDKQERLDLFKKGPDNRFFFMFISAFTTAVSERLLTEGWLRSEKYWYIGEGACPVNTPYLFQYRLLHIMQKRMEDMGLNKLLGINHTDFESSYIKTDIIDVIFAPNDKNVRQSANRHFNNVLSILYNYKNLLVDTHNASNPFDSPESTLATDFVMNNAYIGGFLEHLAQLVYLTAFGTVRQWPEMWEEYQFLKSVVGRIEVIEKYIFKLKNNNVE